MERGEPAVAGEANVRGARFSAPFFVSVERPLLLPLGGKVDAHRARLIIRSPVRRAPLHEKAKRPGTAVLCQLSMARALLTNFLRDSGEAVWYFWMISRRPVSLAANATAEAVPVILLRT